MSFLAKIFGDEQSRVLKKYQPYVDKINLWDKKFGKLSDDEIKAKTAEFKKRIRKAGGDYEREKKILDEILPEAFAAVKNVCKRLKGTEFEIAGIKDKWNMVPFDVQLIGGVVLHQGKISEMKTGEGKTLVATMPVYLNALTGRGVHVVTVNEYLASRDAKWMGMIYQFLGMTVGVTSHGQTPKEKKEAYEYDIIYGTNNEFGFDYLRDNMAADLAGMVQKDLVFAIVDEVDSILIDEARTPLIISAPDEESGKMYQQFARIVPRLKENTDYNIDEKERAVSMSNEGIDKVEKTLGFTNIYTDKGVAYVYHLEQALKAHNLFHRDKDYVVKEGQVLIVDQFTGRLMPGRRYSEGLHQAIEAKEGVEVQKESKTLATITFQNYFRLYKKLSGMTGTAKTQEEEFQKVYNLDVAVIPSNEPMIRKDLPDRIYKTEAGKFKAVVREIKRLSEKGQPVLVGTIAIEKSEILSKMLSREGVSHEVLNAKHHEKEAKIVAKAGQMSAVTIATNMAGRGTDIKLGEGVVKLGGLHVLGTERHEARRIDNQLRGRSGRQGDPGSSQFFVSMEDDLMRMFGSDRMKSIMDTLRVPEDQPIESRIISKQIEGAQKRVEGYNFDARRYILEYDNVMNKHREVIYRRRRRILDAWEYNKALAGKLKKSEGHDKVFKKSEELSVESLKKSQKPSLKNIVFEMIEKEIADVVSVHTSGPVDKEWNIEEIAEICSTFFPVSANFGEKLREIRTEAGDALSDVKARTKLISYILNSAKEAYKEKEKQTSSEIMKQIERAVLLRTIDSLWIDHLDAMENLREGIGLRGYGQRDPLVEYKREGFRLFKILLDQIQRQVTNTIFKVGVVIKKPMPMEGAKNLQGGDDSKAEAEPVKKDEKVGRNDPCPCGSGKKYKKCCGK